MAAPLLNSIPAYECRYVPSCAACKTNLKQWGNASAHAHAHAHAKEWKNAGVNENKN
ncbi:hypothetical protein [Burkholderia gladioli]|uniref:hypothetical protein n=1 Tax=Burkholderia gladioli TaxID=28095 RepID=UPI0016413813|nr:hypothetical protein [Burkholderia gladioli]